VTQTLRIWWDAQRARDNYGEFAGAVVRVGIGFVLLFAYYAWVDWGEQTWGGYLCWGFLAYSLVLFAWIYRSKAASDVARYLPLVVDVVTATTLLGLTGERSAIVWFVYTWTPVAYGLRFGLRYLYVSWIVSVVGCGLVYALSAAVDGFWYEHPLLWLGAFIWVAAPTVYVAILLKQKLAAVQSAEEARVQTERAQADAERERVERARAEAERARAEAEAASEAKSEFLATMSHEMRTPLNGVVGAAELLAAKDLPQRERQLVDWLLASSRQLRSLIDNLLDLRKIEAGKMAIEHSPFDLHVLMNRLAALFEPEAKRAHLRFTKSISADAPYGLVGDDLRIQQVLINMIGNALKFTRQGFVRVSASAPEQSDHEVTLRFEVRDTGIGIPPENAGRIFDRFTQANSGIHRQYGGSGLGTTICKHLVGLMGGAIGFDSRPEGGTTFWFSVPLSRQLAEAHEDGAGVSIRGARLYLVSRSPEAGRWFAKTVRERQMQYASFVSIEDALTTTPRDGNRELCIWIVDGEDDGIRWRDAPRVLGQGGAQSPCILIHPGLADNDAFDAGYVCLLKSRDPLSLVRALRSVVAGTTSVEPLADFSGQQASGRTGLRVLVAEDNQISQQIIAMMLQAGGHLVTLVSDGESVLESYRNASFDVVILDMHMPGRTGLDVARAIRLLEAASRDRRMPIIMLTAAASIDLREDSRDAGVDLFLSKPVDPRALLRGVSQVFSDADHAGTLTAPPPRAPEECIDRVLLQEMAELARDPGFMQTLTRKFSAEARQLVDQIEAAVTGKDRARFRELTHALKGTAMMAGAIRLRDSAARAEITADSVFNGAGADLVEDLRKALEATNHELSRMLA
jgi:two-component system sensor histidine kinase RpfC